MNEKDRQIKEIKEEQELKDVKMEQIIEEERKKREKLEAMVMTFIDKEKQKNKG